MERSILRCLLKIISVILFILGFFEIVGLGFYIRTMLSSSQSACCGIISDGLSASDNGYIPGAVCDVSGIKGFAINHTVDDDGNVWCSVNGTICANKTLEYGEDSEQNVTLSDCFETAGHNVSSLCSAEALNLQAENAETVPIALASFLLLVLTTTTLWTILKMFGCCDRYVKCKTSLSEKCGEKCVIANAILTVVTFTGLFLIGFYYVDNILGNGYGLIAGSNLNTITEVVYGEMSADEIANDVDAACDIGGFSWTDGFIWVNYDIDIPWYLTTYLYEWTSALGLSLGLLEMYMVLRLNCCLDEKLYGEEDSEDSDERALQTDEDRPLNL